MQRYKKIIIAVIICILAIGSFGVASAIGFTNIPYLDNPETYERPPMGELSEGDAEICANGKTILITTIRDYENNMEYYQQKYGLGDYWREDHSPKEPEDVKYKPEAAAMEKGYPIIFED